MRQIGNDGARQLVHDFVGDQELLLAERELARVCTTDQNLDLQRDALTAADCQKTITDTSAAPKPPTGLDRTLINNPAERTEKKRAA